MTRCASTPGDQTVSLTKGLREVAEETSHSHFCLSEGETDDKAVGWGVTLRLLRVLRSNSPGPAVTLG